jgi:hypothetical protein
MNYFKFYVRAILLFFGLGLIGDAWFLRTVTFENHLDVLFLLGIIMVVGVIAWWIYDIKNI